MNKNTLFHYSGLIEKFELDLQKTVNGRFNQGLQMFYIYVYR